MGWWVNVSPNYGLMSPTKWFAFGVPQTPQNIQKFATGCFSCRFTSPIDLGEWMTNQNILKCWVFFSGFPTPSYLWPYKVFCPKNSCQNWSWKKIVSCPKKKLAIFTSNGMNKNPPLLPFVEFWTTKLFLGHTWKIIPWSKQLVTFIYKPFRPFGREITSGRGVLGTF